MANSSLEQTKNIIRLEYALNKLRELMSDEKKNAKQISAVESDITDLQKVIDKYNKSLAKAGK